MAKCFLYKCEGMLEFGAQNSYDVACVQTQQGNGGNRQIPGQPSNLFGNKLQAHKRLKTKVGKQLR